MKGLMIITVLSGIVLSIFHSSPSYAGEKKLSVHFNNVCLGVAIKFFNELTGKKIVTESGDEEKISIYAEMPVNKSFPFIKSVMNECDIKISDESEKLGTVRTADMNLKESALSADSGMKKPDNNDNIDIDNYIRNFTGRGELYEIIKDKIHHTPDKISVRNLPITYFIELMSLVTDKNTVVCSACSKGDVSVVINNPVSINELNQIVESLLRQHGMIAINSEMFVKVVKFSEHER